MGDDRVERSAEVFGLLARFVHRSDQQATAELRRHGLTPAQFQLLRAVRGRPGLVQREVGEQFGVTGGNVSMLVTRLEGAGLLRREPSAAANRLWLTADGEAMLDVLEPELAAWFRDRFAALGDQDLDTLGRLMTAAVEGLPAPP